MVPEFVPCRCGEPVKLRSGADHVKTGADEYEVWYAGGVCDRCGFVVQYAAGHRGGWDLSHCRWWYLGSKLYEDLPGMPRRWPKDWGRPGQESLQ